MICSHSGDHGGGCLCLQRGTEAHNVLPRGLAQSQHCAVGERAAPGASAQGGTVEV